MSSCEIVQSIFWIIHMKMFFLLPRAIVAATAAAAAAVLDGKWD